jgi:hypothetical protein
MLPQSHRGHREILKTEIGKLKMEIGWLARMSLGGVGDLICHRVTEKAG